MENNTKQGEFGSHGSNIRNTVFIQAILATTDRGIETLIPIQSSDLLLQSGRDQLIAEQLGQELF